MIKVLNNRASSIFGWFVIATVASFCVKMETVPRAAFLFVFFAGTTAVHVQQVIEEFANEPPEKAIVPKVPVAERTIDVISVAAKPTFHSMPKTAPNPQPQPKAQPKAVVLEDLWAEPEMAGAGVNMDNWWQED